MKRIVQNIFAHRHAVFTIISVLHQVCYQSKLCVALSDLYVGWVWFGLVCKTLSNLVLHGTEGSSSGPLDVIRVVPHLALASNMLMVAGWGLPPPPDHQSLALSCLHSNFKGWMVWIESGAGSESKTKLIVAGLGLFTISGSPPSF